MRLTRARWYHRYRIRNQRPDNAEGRADRRCPFTVNSRGHHGKDPISGHVAPATWLYLEHLHSKAIDLGLARVSEVAGRMAILKPAPFVFTVAGTNGKGTTCRTLESVLMAAGYKVGVYSSPHLVRYTERVRIQGAELPEAAHTASFAEIEAARGDISLSYFEFGTLSALWLFKQAQLDVVIRRWASVDAGRHEYRRCRRRGGHQHRAGSYRLAGAGS